MLKTIDKYTSIEKSSLKSSTKASIKYEATAQKINY